MMIPSNSYKRRGSIINLGNHKGWSTYAKWAFQYKKNFWTNSHMNLGLMRFIKVFIWSPLIYENGCGLSRRKKEFLEADCRKQKCGYGEEYMCTKHIGQPQKQTQILKEKRKGNS